jgi:hypothetical protein
VQSERDAIAALSALAAEKRRPWGRVEVLRYLPAKWHALAEEFFDGNSLRPPRSSTAALEDPEALSLDEVLQRAAQRPAPQGRERDDDSPVMSLAAQLQADPPTGPDDIIGNVLDAVREEALAIDRETPKRYQLTRGRCIGARGGGFAYMFRWSSEPDLHEPGMLQLGKQAEFPARITGQGSDDKHFEVTVESYLGATVDRAVFKVDPTFLLKSLFEHLKQGRARFPDSTLATGLFHPPEPDRTTGPDVSGLNAEQVTALRTTMESGRSYVWGPPGTGKTTTLGCFIREAAKAGKRTLVLSPYNIAVDEALVAAYRAGGWGPEELVRFGRVSDKVREIGVTLEQLLERRAQASGLLDECRAFCAAAERECGSGQGAIPRTVQLCLERLGEIIMALPRGKSSQRASMESAAKKHRALFRAPEEEILKRARVIGTTVALSYVSQKLQPGLFDYVLVDEASVIRVPEAIVVALRCGGKLAFFGDPKQLPSIVKVSSEKSTRWIRRNPFELAGVRLPADARGSCVMLEEQHRMAPPIRELVSTTFYGGRLRDGRVPSHGRLILIDTSDTRARATTRYTKRSASMENLLHRSVASEFIRAVHREHPEKRILILSPFAAQRRGYDREPNSKNVKTARFATVHASQGTESEVVVLDFVFAPGRRKSAFLDSMVRPEFRNLVNVGLSRAREQLVLVAHTRAIRDHYQGTLLAELIDYFEEKGEVVNVPGSLEMVRLFRTLVTTHDVHHWTSAS